MKKKLLFLVCALVSTIGFSQDVICTKGWQENFSSTGQTGCYPLQITYRESDNTVYQNQVRSGNGKLTFEVTQEENQWWPQQINFGEGSNYVDITSSPIVEIEMVNSGNSGIEVYFWFWSGRTNFYSPGGPKEASGDPSGKPFGGIISAGQTIKFSFDLQGALKRDWYKSNQTACQAVGGTIVGGPCLYNNGFNSSELSTMEVVVVGEATSGTSWAQPALTKHPVSINYIRGGNYSSCPTTCIDVCTDTLKVTVQDTLNIYLSQLITTVYEASKASTTVKVYPNPSAKNLTVEIDNYSNLSGVSIKVLNAQNEEVHNQAVSSSTQSIDVSKWSPGLYFLHVMNGNTTVDIRKIVVNN
jgi:hypothetical protein